MKSWLELLLKNSLLASHRSMLVNSIDTTIELKEKLFSLTSIGKILDLSLYILDKSILLEDGKTFVSIELK